MNQSGHPHQETQTLARQLRERDEEIARLTAWLERIEGGDNPCLDEARLRRWAYEAVTLGHSVPEEG